MRKALISLLVLTLLSPLNASVAAWMAVSMGDSEPPTQHHMDHSTEHAGHAHPYSVPELADADAHEHDAADCDEHCASCTNHCSSLGIVTTVPDLFDPEHHLAGTLSGTPSNRFDLLFRPPISA